MVSFLAIYTLFSKYKYPNWYKYFAYFLIFGLFSWILNFVYFSKTTDFDINFLFQGLLYLVRSMAYSLVAVYVSNNIKNKEYYVLLGKNNLIDKLIYLSVASALFGWIQYLIWPNLTSLKYLGWDDHLLRMVGTFLDPTFLALIIIFGIILAIKSNKEFIINFLTISLAFTYSRISFLILLLLLIYKRKFIALILFFVTILFLPKMIGEGTNLLRTASGINKISNYEETIQIFSKSPIYGIGYNNLCFARQLYLNDNNLKSHSCSGADSSILFILVTTGILGLFIFIKFVTNVPSNDLIRLTFIALLIHSIFSNSMFYPHVMFWVFSLLGLKTEVDSKT